jgi:hypothetical protein
VSYTAVNVANEAGGQSRSQVYVQRIHGEYLVRPSTTLKAVDTHHVSRP